MRRPKLEFTRVFLLIIGLFGAGCEQCGEAAQGGIERGRDGLEMGRDGLERGRDGLERGADALLHGRDRGPSEDASPPPPEREGNRARLLINGEASFLERMRMIDSAERSIHIQALIFKADTAGGAIADRLIERKRENPELDIRVIVDAYANIQDYDAQMLYFELMDAGIEVQGYEPLYLEWMNEINTEDWTAGNKRYHEKYFVVDGERAIVGGMNIGDEYARIGTDAALIWRDQDVYLEGPVVADISRAFDENFRYFQSVQERRPPMLESDGYWRAWRHVHPGLRDAVTRSVGRDRSWRSHPRAPFDTESLEARAVSSALLPDVSVQFIRSRPRLRERWIDEAYRREIAAAERSIVIVNAYFIPTPRLRAALLAAARRGVDVTVITNSKATNDIPMINDAGRIHYGPLMDAGVHIYEWHAEQHGEGTVHAKFAVFDSEVAIIGSYNLDPRSLALNSEDVVVIRDARLATELHERVMHTDARFASRITEAQAEQWSDPSLLPPMDSVPQVPFWHPNFDSDRFELFLIRQAARNL